MPDTRPTRPTVILETEIHGKIMDINYLIDCGSDITLLPESVINAEAINSIEKITQRITTVDKSPLQVIGTICAVLKIPNSDSKIYGKIFITNTQFGSEEIPGILGIDLITKLKLKLDFSNPNQILTVNSIVSNNILSICNTIPNDYRSRFIKIFQKYPEILPTKTGTIGTARWEPYRIELKDFEPFSARPYRTPLHLVQKGEELLNDLMEQGIIAKSNGSEYLSPAVLVLKKNGKLRLTVNFKMLNEKSKSLAIPFPGIVDLLDKLGSFKYFSTLDMSSGFYACALHKESIKYTCFSFNGNIYELHRLPQGFKNSPLYFHKKMSESFDDMTNFVKIFMDDILIGASSIDEMLINTDKVLKRLNDIGLKINLEKSKICETQIKYLGYVVTPDGISSDPDKVKAIVQLAPPTTIKSLQRVLGTFNFYRRLIHNFAARAHNLTDLLRTQKKNKSKKLDWKDMHTQAFNDLKDALSSATKLSHPDLSKEMILTVDSSKLATGGILSQMHSNFERPIAFYSKRFTELDEKRSAFELEIIGLCANVKHFRKYLYGKEFTIYTDCNALKYLNSNKDSNSKLARMAIELNDYDFKVIHKKGTLNIVADMISRADNTNECSALEIGEINDDSEIAYVPVMDIAYVTKEQKKDEQLKTTIRDLQYGMTHPLFVLGDQEALYKRNNKTDITWRLVIPESLRLEVTKIYHSDFPFGHTSLEKALSLMREKVYWPKMPEFVGDYIKKCERCLSNNTHKLKIQGALRPLQQPIEPNYRVSLDLIGPLEITERGNRYILSIICNSTRFAVTACQKTASAEETASSFVEKWIYIFGRPVQILSDNGSNFVSNLFTEIARICGINRLLSTPFVPHSNGLCEKFNKTIASLLRKSIPDDRVHAWDLYLSGITLGYNLMPHKSTGYTPYYLMFAQNGRSFDALDKFSPYTDQDNLEEIVKKNIHIARQLAADNSAKASVKNAERYNSKIHNVTVKEGQLVYIKKEHFPPGSNKKFLDKLSGPFTVLKQNTPTEFEIKTGKTRNSPTKRVHIDKIVPIDIIKEIKALQNEKKPLRLLDDPKLLPFLFNYDGSRNLIRIEEKLQEKESLRKTEEKISQKEIANGSISETPDKQPNRLQNEKYIPPTTRTKATLENIPLPEIPIEYQKPKTKKVSSSKLRPKLLIPKK